MQYGKNVLTPIVTLNYNGKRDTFELVKSISESNEKVHLIIVDNCSPNENEFIDLRNTIETYFGKSFSEQKYDNNDVQISLYLPVNNDYSISLVLSKNNGGFSKGTNIGIKYSLFFNGASNYIAILNNDTIVTSGFISNILSVMDENKDVACSMGTILYYGQEKPYVWSIGGYPVWRLGQCVHVHKDEIYTLHFEKSKNKGYVQRKFVSGCFTVFRTDLLQKIGLLDEDYFFAGEEYQYSYDLSKNHKLAWVPSSLIYHKSVLNIGNGSSHNINSLEWQYAAYRTKTVFVNKNKSFVFRVLWHAMLKAHIIFSVKKRLLSNRICNKKQFSVFKATIFDRINSKSFTSKEFVLFKDLIND